MEHTEEKRFLNVEKIAIYLDVSQHTIRDWVKTGFIPFFKIGRAVRFDKHRINEWLKPKECPCLA